MKVIKRDGRAVDYDRQKIITAIEKANREVRQIEKASREDINKIIYYIEEFGKKRMLVEDIQDIIEQKLMEIGKYELAKKYIVYRYTRALVRKQNTTDESILGLIRKNNNYSNSENGIKTSIIASAQRDLIAGEVSKDLTKRMLLPEKISNAHEEGILHFHNSDYFLQPIFNSSIINISDMLDNGTVINGKAIESPKTFYVACIVMTQIIACIAAGQYGGQTINLAHLGKYLNKSYKKYKNELSEKFKDELDQEKIEKLAETMLKTELRQGIQIIQYQINILFTINGKAPLITLFLNLGEDEKYKKENALIIEEILKQSQQGLKNEEGNNIVTRSPELIYLLTEDNCLQGGAYDYLTNLSLECIKKGVLLKYVSAKKMEENHNGNTLLSVGDTCFLLPKKDKNNLYRFEGRFNQGVVSINLPQIGLVVEGNEEKFWTILDERLELCKEALMCRHYSLLGTTSDVSPIHWRYGAIARLQQGEKIDKLLKEDYSTLSLGYIGIYEITQIMKGVSHTTKEGREFAIKLIKCLKTTVDKWKKETGLEFALYGNPEEEACYRFAHIDKEKFGTIKNITDKEYYTNSYYLYKKENTEVLNKLAFESNLQKISLCGAISHIEIQNIDNNSTNFEELIRFIYENVHCAQFIIE